MQMHAHFGEFTSTLQECRTVMDAAAVNRCGENDNPPNAADVVMPRMSTMTALDTSATPHQHAHVGISGADFVELKRLMEDLRDNKVR